MVEPSRATTPSRAPIEVLSNDRTAPRLAGAAVTRSLTRGAWGLYLVGTSLALGAIMSAANQSLLVGVVLTLGLSAAQAVATTLRARRAFRKMAPTGQRLVSGYDDRGRLTLATALGTTALSPGSIDRAERRDGLVQLRTVPGRRWIVLPGQLLTEEDTAYLLDGARARSVPATVAGSPTGGVALEAPGQATPTSGSTSADSLPLMHVVDAKTRRDLQSAVATHVLRSRNGRIMVACLLLTGACTALVRDWVVFSLLGLLAVLATLSVVAPVMAVRRNRPLGHLFRAAVTPTLLVVQEGDNDNRLPWSSIRSCTTTRRAVILTMRHGVILPLPRALFPAADLARLHQLVHDSRSPVGG